MRTLSVFLRLAETLDRVEGNARLACHLIEFAAAEDIRPIIVRQERIDDETIELHVEGGDLGLMIGPKGATLSSIQELAHPVITQLHVTRRDSERLRYLLLVLLSLVLPTAALARSVAGTPGPDRIKEVKEISG